MPLPIMDGKATALLSCHAVMVITRRAGMLGTGSRMLRAIDADFRLHEASVLTNYSARRTLPATSAGACHNCRRT